MFYWILTVRDALREPSARGALRSAALLLLTGILFYVLVEDWTFVDALYFCVTTLTTVGFGDPAPTTDVGKIFTVFFMISGIGMFLAVVNGVGRAAVKNQIQGTTRAKRRSRNPEQDDGDDYVVGAELDEPPLPSSFDED